MDYLCCQRINDLFNMDLHKALKKAVELEGVEVLMNRDVLMDYLELNLAFEKFAQAKEILMSLIENGYVNEMKDGHGYWDDYERPLLERFVSETNYQENLSLYVIQSIAYAMDWIDYCAIPSKRIIRTNNTITEYDNSDGTEDCNADYSNLNMNDKTIKKDVKPKSEITLNDVVAQLCSDGDSIDKGRAEALANSIVEIKEKTVARFGISLSGVYVEILDQYKMVINVELEGDLKKTESCHLYIAIFDSLCRVREKLEILKIDSKNYHGYMIANINVSLKLSIFELSKICMFMA